MYIPQVLQDRKLAEAPAKPKKKKKYIDGPGNHDIINVITQKTLKTINKVKYGKVGILVNYTLCIIFLEDSLTTVSKFKTGL